MQIHTPNTQKNLTNHDLNKEQPFVLHVACYFLVIFLKKNFRSSERLIPQEGYSNCFLKKKRLGY